ncbi:MAG: hypothetical protein ACTHJI_18545 [Leifsonia sp.]
MTNSVHSYRLAYWLLIAGGAAYSAISIVSLFLIDWEGISHTLGLNLGLVSVAIWLGWSLNVAAFAALPFASAFELRSGSSVGWTMCVIVVFASVAVVPLLGWPALIGVAVYGAALVSLASSGTRATLKSGRGARWERKKKRTSIGYVLFVAGGGFLGIHHYYLKRTWQGILYLALLLWGTSLWPTNYAYILWGVLVVLNIWDAATMRARVAKLNQRIVA